MEPSVSEEASASDMDSWLAGFDGDLESKPELGVDSTAAGSTVESAVDLLSDESLDSDHDHEEPGPMDDLFAEMPALSPTDKQKKDKKEKKKRKSEKSRHEGPGAEKKRKDDEVAQFIEQLESTEDICEMCACKSSQAQCCFDLEPSSLFYISVPRSKASAYKLCPLDHYSLFAFIYRGH